MVMVGSLPGVATAILPSRSRLGAALGIGAGLCATGLAAGAACLTGAGFGAACLAAAFCGAAFFADVFFGAGLAGARFVAGLACFGFAAVFFACLRGAAFLADLLDCLMGLALFTCFDFAALAAFFGCFALDFVLAFDFAMSVHPSLWSGGRVL